MHVVIVFDYNLIFAASSVTVFMFDLKHKGTRFQRILW